MGLTVDTRIAKKFKHRVYVCRNEDVIVDNQLTFTKNKIWEGWAMIERRRVSTFSQQGHSVLEENDRRSHFIRMRYNPFVELTAAAWLYEHRVLSAPRWFKILSSGDEDENSQYFLFDCRLMERGDDLAAPVGADGSIVGVPAGITL